MATDRPVPSCHAVITGSINDHCPSDKLGCGFRSLTRQPQQAAELGTLASDRAPHHRATTERLKSPRPSHFWASPTTQNPKPRSTDVCQR
jgi:hypothetical protein